MKTLAPGLSGVPRSTHDDVDALLPDGDPARLRTDLVALS